MAKYFAQKTNFLSKKMSSV